MMPRERWSVELDDPKGTLRLYEPDRAALQAAAPQLCAFYNEPHNSRMMTNTCRLSTAEVLDHFEDIWRENGRAFLLERGGVLVGDSDFHNLRGGIAEFALLVGNRAVQGEGLGRRYTLMAHALLFRHLGAERAYSVVVPENAGCLRMLDNAGYSLDNSDQARALAESDDELALSLAREGFEERNADLLARLRFAKTVGP
jgi:RimJ/RimL family protein N-acetyltransferase